MTEVPWCVITCYSVTLALLPRLFLMVLLASQLNIGWVILHMHTGVSHASFMVINISMVLHAPMVG